MSTKDDDVLLPALFAWLAAHDPTWAAEQRRRYLASSETRDAGDSTYRQHVKRAHRAEARELGWLK